MIIHDKQILGVILAGGLNRRMGHQPKWELNMGTKSLMQHCVHLLTPQVATIVINGSHQSLAKYNYPIIEDAIPDQGPLAGLLASLQYADNQGFQWVATCPCDAPFFPADYVQQLRIAITNGRIGAVIKNNNILHGVFGLWSTQLTPLLTNWLQTPDNRSIKQWVRYLADQCEVVEIESNDTSAFFNINTPKDYQSAKKAYSP